MLKNINYLWAQGKKSYAKMTYDSSNLVTELELSTPDGGIYMFKINYSKQQINDVSIFSNSVLILKSYYNYSNSIIKIEHERIKLFSLPEEFFSHLANGLSKVEMVDFVKKLAQRLLLSNTYSELTFKNNKLKTINIHSKKEDGTYIQSLKSNYSVSPSKTKSEISLLDDQNQWLLYSSTEISKFQKSSSPIIGDNIFLAICGFGIAGMISAFFPESAIFNDRNYQNLMMTFLGNKIFEPYKNLMNAGNLIERDTDLTQTTSYSRVKTYYGY